MTNGTIPTEDGQLSRLTDLATWGGTGTIPNALFQLTNLESLKMRNSNLHGTLPTELGLLAELKYLDLTNSAFTGSSPNDLGLLSKLTSLWLSGLSVTGTFPCPWVTSENDGPMEAMVIDCALVNCSCGCSCA